MSRIDDSVGQTVETNDQNITQQTLALDELSPQSLYAKCTTLAQLDQTFSFLAKIINFEPFTYIFEIPL